MTDDEKAFADWTAAGNGVPLQYKGREHVWDRKVDARMKKGGEVHMDEGGAAFYPRVGNIKAKNFKSAKPMPFVEDPRAMDLPMYGDLSIPTRENLEMARRMAQRDADLKRQREGDRSPLEKLAGGVQAGRFLGSAMTQGINAMPTRIVKGDEAADKFMQERLYKPDQPTAYEYAGDVGDFLEKLETEYKIPPVLPEAMALQYLTGPAASQAKKAAGRGAQALEKRLDPLVTKALERGGLQRDLLLDLGQQANVIKPKGGNWLTGSVEKALKPLKRGEAATPQEVAKSRAYLDNARATWSPENQRQVDRMEREFELLRANDALINWVDRNLTNYVKKEMATPEDPVRRLADQGIVHIPPEEVGMNRYRAGAHRSTFGGQREGISEAARAWEDSADVAISPYTVGEIKKAKETGGPLSGLYEPWMDKADEATEVYKASKELHPNYLGFDHIMDVLREDLATGRIRPEQMNKISITDAVRRTAQYDQELAKKMNESRAAARADLPVYKDYPEGYKWIELNKPGSFANESEAMGHSVRGYEPPKGHPDWVEGSGDSGSSSYGHGGWEAIKSGKAKVYSLVGPKGEPHATVEVKTKGVLTDDDFGENDTRIVEGRHDFGEMGYITTDNQFFESYADAVAHEKIIQKPTLEELQEPSSITQIKGKQNRAPNEEYLPYVQDFVRGGKWSDVGDFRNTGLTRKSDLIDKFSPDELDSIGVGEYLTKAEQEELLYRSLNKRSLGLTDELGLTAPPEGMARGGEVHMAGGGAAFGQYTSGKKYQKAKERAENADVNLLPDPRTYAAVSSFLGTAPDELGFSVMHPDYKAIREIADPAFNLGLLSTVAPFTKGMPVGASIKPVKKAPQEEALKLAQQRASLPKEMGGLGLPIKNTAEQRAEAMGAIDYMHGTERLDRFLEAKNINSKRATSGPMPFGTDSGELASNYAMNKADTSRIANDMGDMQNYFQVFPKSMGERGTAPYSVEQLWYRLPQEKKAEILQKSKRVGFENFDESSGPLTLHPEGVNAMNVGEDTWNYFLNRESKGNPLTALRKLWGESGNLFGNEDKLADVYKLVGFPYEISQTNAPWTSAKGVMIGKAMISNPLDTSNMSELQDKVIPFLKEQFKNDRTRTKAYGADQWDKNTRYTPKEWVANLEKDIAAGKNSFVWTSIPDKITNSLKDIGYNGILDKSGKGGGNISDVVIPFSPEQVRSRFAAFDPFRKTAATAAAMGVAAPDLLAEENTKARGGLSSIK